MESTRLSPRVCMLVTAVITLLGVILRSLCMLTAFDTTVGYFDAGLTVTLANVLPFVAVAAAATAAALIRKDAMPYELNTPCRLPAACLFGVALAAFSVGVLLTCYAERTNKFVAAPMALGILASLYFFASARKNGRYSDGLCALGFLPVVWCVAAAWETYSDQFTAMNSPIKISLQMGFLGLALILISELRFRLGKPLPRVAAALMSVGVFFSLTGSVPVLLGTGARILSNELHVFYAAVLLCGGLYGAYILFRYLWSPAETPASPEASAISAEVPAEEPEESPADTPNAE